MVKKTNIANITEMTIKISVLWLEAAGAGMLTAS
jgi:hypothetical protein